MPICAASSTNSLTNFDNLTKSTKWPWKLNPASPEPLLQLRILFILLQKIALLLASLFTILLKILAEFRNLRLCWPNSKKLTAAQSLEWYISANFSLPQRQLSPRQRLLSLVLLLRYFVNRPTKMYLLSPTVTMRAPSTFRSLLLLLLLD